MGGSQSSTVINGLSESISNIASNTVQNCVVNSDQSQDVTYNNSGWSLWTTATVSQSTDISVQCFSDSAKQAQLQNEIINLIAQSATTKGVALLDAFAAPNSTAVANLTNIVRNNVTMSNIQSQYTTIKQNQKVTFNNSGINVFSSSDVSQGAKVFAMSTLSVIESSGIMTKIANHVDQSANTSTENPLNFLADIASAISGGLITGVAGAVMFFIFLIILVFGGGYLLISLIGRGVGSAASGVGNVANGVASGIANNVQPIILPPLVDMDEFNASNVAADIIVADTTDNTDNIEMAQ